MSADWRKTIGPQLLNKGGAFWRLYTLNEVIQYYGHAINELRTNEAKRELRRELVRNDLFYLLAWECGRKDVVHPWVFERCREAEAYPDGFIDLWPREHFKSSILTFGKTIQDILTNPELTFGIFSHTKANAKKFSKQIKEEFEKNPNLYYLFPEILYANPKTEASRWTDEAFTVKRSQNPKEATVEAHGVLDGMPTAAHFDVRVYDDLVTEKSVTSPEITTATTDKWALSTSLGKEGGKERYIGTFYSMHDTYFDILQRKAATPRIYSCTEDGSEDFSKAVLMSPEALAKRRSDQGEYIFSCQYLLKPRKSGTMGFKVEWLDKRVSISPEYLNVFMIVDPSSGEKQKEGKEGSDERDFTAIWVLGLGADKKVRVLDFVRDKLNLGERWKTILRLHRQHRAQLVFYERVGMQSDIEHFRLEGARMNYEIEFVELNPKAMGSKPVRILSLIPRFEKREIIMPLSCVHTNAVGIKEDMLKTFIEQEYIPYPIVRHKDGLDALAYINHPIVKAMVPVPQESYIDDVITDYISETEYRPVV